MGSIANDLRGKVDGWDFKTYVLGTIFYRYLCDHLVYIINTEQQEAGVDGFDYADLTDEEAETERYAFTEMLGYYILPSQPFDVLAEDADDNDDLGIELDQAFKAVEQSTANADSAEDFQGLFQDFDVNSNKHGGSTIERSNRLATIIKAIKKLDLGDFNDTDIVVFGDAYESAHVCLQCRTLRWRTFHATRGLRSPSDDRCEPQEKDSPRLRSLRGLWPSVVPVCESSGY